MNCRSSPSSCLSPSLYCFIPFYTRFTAMLIELSTAQSCPYRLAGSTSSPAAVPTLLFFCPALSLHALVSQPAAISAHYHHHHKSQSAAHASLSTFSALFSGFSCFCLCTTKFVLELKVGGKGSGGGKEDLLTVKCTE